MERLTVCETVLGKYAVRPHDWAGLWKDGKLVDGMNSIAVFEEKEDAEWYTEAKNAEEQGLLLRLPCKVGDTVYIVMRLHYQPNGLDMSQYEEVEEVKVDNITIGKPYWQINGDEHEFLVEDFGKSIFLTKEEAEQALKGGAV